MEQGNAPTANEATAAKRPCSHNQNKFSHYRALTDVSSLLRQALEGHGFTGTRERTALCPHWSVARCHQLSHAPPSPLIPEDAGHARQVGRSHSKPASAQEPASRPPLHTAFHVGISAWQHTASQDRHCRQPISIALRETTCAAWQVRSPARRLPALVMVSWSPPLFSPREPYDSCSRLSMRAHHPPPPPPTLARALHVGYAAECAVHCHATQHRQPRRARAIQPLDGRRPAGVFSE